MSVLDKYLKKLGVSSYLELNDEEKNTFREWELALSGRQITDADVATFLEKDLEEATVKLCSVRLNERDDTFLKMKVEFIRNLQGFLDSPRIEKEMMEAQIKSQI